MGILRSFSLALAGLALVAIPTGRLSADPIIVNGDFSAPNGVGGFVASNAGWTSTPDTSGEVNPSPVYGLACWDTACFNAEVNVNQPDTLSQNVTGLTIGQNYTITWEYGLRSGTGFQQTQVSFGGVLVQTDSGSTYTGQWINESVTVTATATSEVLAFHSTAPGNGLGNELTGICIDGTGVCAPADTGSVPEPGTMILLGTGLLGVVRRWRALFRR